MVKRFVSTKVRPIVTQTFTDERVASIASSSNSESYPPEVPRSFCEIVRQAACDKMDVTGMI